jgi:hypothetical protein
MSDLSANPLAQYFRRPALYLKLPSGGAGYPVGTIDLPENGELAVYPMTAIDEITTRTPDALFNGTAVVELIKSCVPSIKDPWYVSVNDLDPILVAIRAATSGSLMEINTSCPSCEEDAKYDVNLSAVLASFTPGNYGEPLQIGDLKIKFKPLPYKELNTVNMAQFDIQRMVMSMESVTDPDEKAKKGSDLLRNINEIAIRLLSTTIEYIRTPQSTVLDKNFIAEFLRNCDKDTFDKIKTANLELRTSTETKPLEIKCIHCGHEYKQPFTINVTDFFE